MATIDLVVVGAGGGGAAPNGGGGGGGKVAQSSGVSVTLPATLTITVGQGHAGADGDASTAFGVTAPGGKTGIGTVTQPTSAPVDFLVVAGGGGGGGGTGYGAFGGGGGGGGVVQGTYQTGAGSYAITVGAGGPGAHGTNTRAANGGDSAFGGYVAKGGGGGGNSSANPPDKLGSAGGSGGGSASSDANNNPGGAASQGFPGGRGDYTGLSASGGGGGQGQAGGVGNGHFGGACGIGFTAFDGSQVGGGGGGNGQQGRGLGGVGGGGNGGAGGVPDTPGVPNTGGGGGGGTGQDGGSGKVVLRYPTGALIATGGNISTSGGYTYHTFPNVGTVYFTVTDPFAAGSNKGGAAGNGNAGGAGALGTAGGGGGGDAAAGGAASANVGGAGGTGTTVAWYPGATFGAGAGGGGATPGAPASTQPNSGGGGAGGASVTAGQDGTVIVRAPNGTIGFSGADAISVGTTTTIWVWSKSATITAYVPATPTFAVEAEIDVGTDTTFLAGGPFKAYLWARSKVARSHTTRSGYIAPAVTVLLTTYDANGNSTGTQDLSHVIQRGTLHISQQLNQPDRCTFTLIPQTPFVPHIGDRLMIGLAAVGGGTTGAAKQVARAEFGGGVVSTTNTRRNGNLPPWISVTCQAWDWWFDSRLVTWAWPSQSANLTIADLVNRFVNNGDRPSTSPVFSVADVQSGLATLDAFEVSNARPTDVLRQITGLLGGGFYVDPHLILHAWGGGAEQLQTDPVMLTNDLQSLKSFQHTYDGTQLRSRVIVEGSTASVQIDIPQGATTNSLPLDDETLLRGDDPTVIRWTRFGSQWGLQRVYHGAFPVGNPPQTTAIARAVPNGTAQVNLDFASRAVAPPSNFEYGFWLKVGDTFLFCLGLTDLGSGNWRTALNTQITAAAPYGSLASAIEVGAQITGVDYAFWGPVAYIRGLAANSTAGTIRHHPVDSPFMVLTNSEDTRTNAYPYIESLVQDGRYSYAGAQARGDSDLTAFQNPLLQALWETDDFNARPGRLQRIHLTDVDPLDASLTILSAEVTVDLLIHAPRRVCTAGAVKPSTLLDVLLTNPT
jgi:hypothetical protein